MTNLTQARLFRHENLPFLLAALLLALLAGCAGGPAPAPQATPSAEEAQQTEALEKMVRQGRHLDAALAYSRLANRAAPPLREMYSLRAAELLKDGNYIPQSFQLLSEIQGANLGPEFHIRRVLLTADIALARQRPDEALAVLDSITSQLADDERDFRRRYHQLRAQAFEQLGQPLESAREHVLLEPLLDDPAAVQANQFAIVDELQQLTPQVLDGLAADEFGGWLALAAIGKGVDDSLPADELIARWRAQYPQHPASEATIARLLAARPQALRTPRRIALILPLGPRNRYAKAAEAVRNGFFAAYYARPRQAMADAVPGDGGAPHLEDAGSNAPPLQLRIYEEGRGAEAFDAVYQQAVADGADLVVGPLGKDAVSRLASRESLPVPVLALNYGEMNGAPPRNLFQLGLSPEQEAREVAQRAWLDGHRRTAVITPSTPWGDRVAKAFNERWLALGGHVVEVQHYDPKKNDYSLPIRRLLNVDESQARRKSVRRIIGEKIEFIPRRRQDIDAIFMVAFSRQARVIRPQLRFHHAPKVPVYTTSHAFSGTVDPQMDRDMDGVMFADMPWTLAPDALGQRLKGDIARAWPGAARRYTRLHALGVDAYRVIGQLNELRRDRAAHFAGETGELSLDADNRLQRRLLWARFQRGVPQLDTTEN
ncbi:MAG TPA: penicillin-binding protein activator [Gammaproteobacteria bacterium]|nr:penicillin-binding protein activator [Gammaproteobacteria bacterium]